MKTWIKIVLVLIVSAVSGYVQASETCARPGQEGCWDLVIANVRFDASNAQLRGLDKPYASEAEHQERVSTLGPRLMGSFRSGQVQAAKPRTFLVMVWGMETVVPAMYKIDGTRTSRARFEDVTANVAFPKFDEKQNLGKPSFIYRVSVDGQNPIGASLQFPWSKVTDKTYVLICSEDDLTVYPSGGKGAEKQGFWFMPDQLAFFRTNGVRGSVAPFLSTE